MLRVGPPPRILGQRQGENNPITIKPETVSQVAEQSPWVPSPSCSPPGRPFPVKSLPLTARVPPWTVHFQTLDKSPLSGPGRGSPLPATQPLDTLSWENLLEELLTLNKGSQFLNCSESLLPSLRASNTSSDFSYAPLLSDAATRKGVQISK